MIELSADIPVDRIVEAVESSSRRSLDQLQEELGRKWRASFKNALPEVRESIVGQRADPVFGACYSLGMVVCALSIAQRVADIRSRQTKESYLEEITNNLPSHMRRSPCFRGLHFDID